jgi:hypothetical protein
MLDELARRAAATGLSVTYRLSGFHDSVASELAQAAYPVTQEVAPTASRLVAGRPETRRGLAP